MSWHNATGDNEPNVHNKTIHHDSRIALFSYFQIYT